MARYYQRPQNDIVDLTPRIPLEFYSNMINQAQQNLNQASATGAAFMSDAYGQEFIDQASRDKAMALAQDPISKALDRDFVTPATIAKAVGQASQAIAPWKNINKVHLEQAKREQALRDKLGANYIGNSVMQQSLMTPEGNWISADDIKLTAGNREDLVQALAKDNAGRADLKRDFESKWNTILGGKAFEKKIKKVLGLTEEERVAEFVNNQEMAKKYLAQMPEFAKAIAASGADPVEYMTQEIDQWSKQLVRGYDYDSKYIDNPDYKIGSGFTHTGAPLKAATYDRGVSEIEKTKLNLNRARAAVDPDKYTNPSQESWAERNLGVVKDLNDFGDFVAQKLTGDKNAKLNPLHTLFTDEDFVVSEKKGQEVLKEAKIKYKSIYKQIDKTAEFLEYMPDKKFDPAKLSDADYRKQVQKARDLAFLDRVEIIESDIYSPLTSYDPKDKDFNEGMDATVFNGIKGKTKVKDDSGKDVLLSDLYKKDKVRKFLARNDGNLDIVADGKVHSLHIFDDNGSGTGVIDDRSEAILNVQKKLYEALWATEDDDIMNTNVSYGNIPVPVPGYNGLGIPVYTVRRNDIAGQPNDIYVTYYDPETGAPHTDERGNTLTYPTTLNEIAQNTTEVLKLVNPNPAKAN